MVGEIIAAILLALIIGALFFFGFRATGPWGSFWTFLLILFFGIWVFAIWVDPIGPLWYGIAWIDFLFVGLILALILAAATPDYRRRSRSDVADSRLETEESASTAVALSIYFWVLLILFIGIILFGLLL